MSSTETCKGTSCYLRAAVLMTCSKYKRDTNSAKEMLSGVFSNEVDSKIKGDTGLRHLVVGLNKFIWDYSCRIIFEREAFVFEMLKARLFARVEPFVKDLIENH